MLGLPLKYIQNLIVPGVLKQTTKSDSGDSNNPDLVHFLKRILGVKPDDK